MKLTIKQFSKLVGVSTRTLDYYDTIGLLKPDYIDNNTSYRYYGNKNYLRMQEIMFYKELDFSLKDISIILSSQNYDQKTTFLKQKELLILKRNRLNNIINSIDNIIKGETIDMKIFKDKEYIEAKDKYKDEVINRWSNTNAYKEHLNKTQNYTKEVWQEIGIKLNNIFKEFNTLLINKKNINDIDVLNQVKVLQDFISETQYTCTKEILLSLGNMYINDERFKNNIDKVGLGTAEFINKAIIEYCK